jgi:hypothetical protein
MLHAIFPARWKFQTVPAIARAIKREVENMYRQLFAVESTANGLVAKIISFPVLIGPPANSEFAQFLCGPGAALTSLATKPSINVAAEEIRDAIAHRHNEYN